MRPNFSRYKTDLLIALGLLLLPLIFFWPVTLGGRTLLPADNLCTVEPWQSACAQWGVSLPHNGLLSDLVLENYPWKKFIAESLQARQLPLWNPYQFSGEPFLATGQHSALYPFSIIFYILPLPLAYGWFTVLQFFLAGLFTYIFLRVLGLRRLSATFGAIVYEFSLFMVVSVVFTMIIAAAAWLPLILACIELMARQHPALGGRPATLPWLVLGAVALGIQILAGHIEITYYTLLVSGAYSAWRLGALFFSLRRENSIGVSISTVIRRALALLALAGLGVTLGAIQLVPLYELVQHNFRSGSATFEQIVGWAYPWRHALHFLIPNFYGNPSHHTYLDLFTGQWTLSPLNNHTIDWGIKNYVEGGAYVGLLPLLLVAVVFIKWSIGNWSTGSRLTNHQSTNYQLTAPQLPFFFLLAFFSLAFIFPTRLYAIIFWLPGINQLHSAFRWVWPLTLSVAALSAYGIEYLHVSRASGQKSEVSNQKPSFFIRHSSFIIRLFCLWSQPSLITFFAGLAVWGGTFTVLGLIAVRVWYERFAGLMDRLVNELALANQAFTDGRMFFSYEARWVFIFALMLVAAGIVLRVSRCPIYFRGRAVWEYLALIVIMLDLFVAGWGFNPSADPAILAYTPPSVTFLKQDQSLWRFTSYDTQGRKPFNANLGWYFNFQDVRGYDSIFPMQYRKYMELIQPQGELEYNRIAPISEPGALNSPLLDLLNVKYVITQEPIDNPKYTLVYSAEVRIYQNQTAMPRAFTLPATATMRSDDFGQTVQSVDPRRSVIVSNREWPIELFNMFAPADPAPVAESDIQYSPNEVTVATWVDQPSWLILADSYFPGWKAFIRESSAPADAEKEIPIHLVNGNFRGVLIEPGAWTVRFKYTPDSVKIGGIASFVALITLAFGLGVWLWRYFYQESAVDSTARRIAKNSLAPMALNLVNRFIALVFAMFYLRVLGPGDAGKYATAIVIFGWFEIISNYGLNTLLTRDASRDRQHANRYLVNTTILRLLIGLAIIPVLALLLGLRQMLANPLATDTLWAIAILVLAQAPATVSTGLSALFYVYEKAEYPAAVATCSTILTVALGTVALILGFGIVGLAGVSILVNVVTLGILAALAWRMFFKPRLELDFGLQRHALRESFPLMLNHLLATLFFKVDVPMLETIRNQQQAGLGDKEVGWYNTAYKFLDAYNVIPSFFTQALFPVMSRQAREDRPALKRSYALSVKLLVATALPLAVVTAFSAPLMIGVLGGAEYLPFGAVALAIMVWSIPFGWINSVTNYLLIALDQQRGLTRAFALALGFNVIANLIFIPLYGYPAAAVITILSEIFEGLWFYWYLRKSLGPIPWAAWLWRLWFSAAVMAGITYALWDIQPLLAIMAGLAAYAAGMAGLKAFNAEERATLMDILPARLRGR